MKALKIGGFFLAGAIIQTVFYFAEYLGLFVGYGGLIIITLMITCLGVLLGCTARNLAREKMKMSPFVLTMCYVAGTLVVIAAMFIGLPTIHSTSTGLDFIPTFEGESAIWLNIFALPSAAINAVVQIVLCVREKIKLNKEKQNGTL